MIISSFLGKKFAIGSSDKNVGICYYETEQRFWAAEMIKKKPKSAITSVAWHPNSQILAVGSYDYRVRLYSALVKAVDKQVQTSAWGPIAQTGELLQEFQTGKMTDSLFREEIICSFRNGLDT